jgi:hypothetical protein
MGSRVQIPAFFLDKTWLTGLLVVEFRWIEYPVNMKKRGLKSPDRADAYVLTFGEYMVEPDEHIMTFNVTDFLL